MAKQKKIQKKIKKEKVFFGTSNFIKTKLSILTRKALMHYYKFITVLFQIMIMIMKNQRRKERVENV